MPGTYCPQGSAHPRPCDAGHYCGMDYLNQTSGICNAGFFCSVNASRPDPMDGVTGVINLHISLSNRILCCRIASLIQSHSCIFWGFPANALLRCLFCTRRYLPNGCILRRRKCVTLSVSSRILSELDWERCGIGLCAVHSRILLLRSWKQQAGQSMRCWLVLSWRSG